MNMSDDALQALQGLFLGFAMAALLREGGYIVKLHLGGKGPTDIVWSLEVHSQSPRFVLTEVATQNKYELQSSEEVLGKLKV